MYWQKDAEDMRATICDKIVNLNFKLVCKSLPLDHAWALSNALTAKAPWLASSNHIAIHLIHGAESSNGWMRPNNTDNEILHLSRRTRFTLRVHQDDLCKVNTLLDTSFDIKGHKLKFIGYKQQIMAPQTTIFSRYIVTENDISENGFLNAVAPKIEALGVNIKKMMGGKQHTFRMPKGIISTRSLMISDLQVEESITLQQYGIGQMQLFGMGIFLPHKGISPVKQINENEALEPL